MNDTIIIFKYTHFSRVYFKPTHPLQKPYTEMDRPLKEGISLHD